MDYSKTKFRLIKNVLEPEQDNILVIGDDENSEVCIPEDHGMKTRHLKDGLFNSDVVRRPFPLNQKVFRENRVDDMNFGIMIGLLMEQNRLNPSNIMYAVPDYSSDRLEEYQSKMKGVDLPKLWEVDSMYVSTFRDHIMVTGVEDEFINGRPIYSGSIDEVTKEFIVINLTQLCKTSPVKFWRSSGDSNPEKSLHKLGLKKLPGEYFMRYGNSLMWKIPVREGMLNV